MRAFRSLTVIVFVVGCSGENANTATTPVVLETSAATAAATATTPVATTLQSGPATTLDQSIHFRIYGLDEWDQFVTDHVERVAYENDADWSNLDQLEACRDKIHIRGMQLVGYYDAIVGAYTPFPLSLVFWDEDAQTHRHITPHRGGAMVGLARPQDIVTPSGLTGQVGSYEGDAVAHLETGLTACRYLTIASARKPDLDQILDNIQVTQTPE